MYRYMYVYKRQTLNQVYVHKYSSGDIHDSDAKVRRAGDLGFR